VGYLITPVAERDTLLVPALKPATVRVFAKHFIRPVGTVISKATDKGVVNSVIVVTHEHRH
jgi:hypothetical protein